MDLKFYFAQICRHGDFGQETNPERNEFAVLDAARAQVLVNLMLNLEKENNSFLGSEVLILNRRIVFMTFSQAE